MSFRNYYDSSSSSYGRSRNRTTSSTSAERPTTVTAKYINTTPSYKSSSIPILSVDRPSKEDTPISTIANRYSNYSKTEKPVATKYDYSNNKSEKAGSKYDKKDYSKLTIPSITSTSKSRDVSPVSTSKYNLTRPSRHLSPERKITKSFKDKTRDTSPTNRDKDIPCKTDKPTSYSSLSSYKLLPRASNYTRPSSRADTKGDVTVNSYSRPSSRTETRSEININSYTRPSSRVDKSESSVSNYTRSSTRVDAKSDTAISNFPRPSSRPDTKPELSVNRYAIANRLSSNYLRSPQTVKGTSVSPVNFVDSTKNEIEIDVPSVSEEKTELQKEKNIESNDQVSINEIPMEKADNETETIIVVTRHTSPTPPGSSAYVRTRRADMAKTVEKTLKKTKRKPEMADKEIQSDRLDDPTRSSRFGSTARTSMTNWSYYSPGSSNYTGYAGRYSTQYSNLRDSSGGNSISPNERSSRSRSIEPEKESNSSCLLDQNNKEENSNQPSCNNTETICKETLLTDSSDQKKTENNSEIMINVNLKLKPTKSSASTELVSPEIIITNSQLPPQAPKTDSGVKTKKPKAKKTSSDSSSDSGSKKKIIKKRSKSVSSTDSDQSNETNDRLPGQKPITKTPSKSNLQNGLPKLRLSKARESNSPESSTTLSTQSSISEDENISKSKTNELSRTSADEVSIPTDRSEKQPSPSRNENGTEEAKSFLIRALAPVTNLFKMRHQESSENSRWPETSTSESTGKDVSNLTTESDRSSIGKINTNNIIASNCDNLVKLKAIRPIESGERAWWLDSESENKNNSQSNDNETPSSEKKFGRRIRHEESGEKAWWQESSDVNSENKQASYPTSHNKSSENINKIIRKCKFADEEKPWWLDSCANIPEGIERLSPPRKTSSDSDKSEKYNFFQVRRIESDDQKDWWLTSNENSANSSKLDQNHHISQSISKSDSERNFPLRRIRHVESGERPWWLSSNKNIPEGVEKLPTPPPPDESDSSDSEVQVYVPSTNIPPFPLHLPDDEPLGTRRSPEGLETPKEADEYRGRASPYENNDHFKRRPNSYQKRISKYISRYSDIDDILGTSGQIYSPFMDSILARRTGHISFDDDECEEIDPTQVRIHDSTAQRPVIKKIGSRPNIIDCREEDQLDDATLQVFKDGDYGPYLDLDSSLGEQEEELEGLQDRYSNFIHGRVKNIWWYERNDSVLPQSVAGYDDKQILVKLNFKKFKYRDNNYDEEINKGFVGEMDANMRMSLRCGSVEEYTTVEQEEPDRKSRQVSLDAGIVEEDVTVKVTNSNKFICDMSDEEGELIVLEEFADLLIYCNNRKNALVLRTQLSVRVHAIIEKLLHSQGRELRRALFTLKQILQFDKDLVHEFVANKGLDCLMQVGNMADHNYLDYILRALGQILLYVDGMHGVMAHQRCIQWLYSLIASKYRHVVKTALKLLLVFVEYTEKNCLFLIDAIAMVDGSNGRLPWWNIMQILQDFDASDTELLIYATTLINRCLNNVPDRDTYYDQVDALQDQGINEIIQLYMSKQGTDLDLLRQLQIFDAVLLYEDGDESGTSLKQLDDSVINTIRRRSINLNISDRRRSKKQQAREKAIPTSPHTEQSSNHCSQFIPSITDNKENKELSTAVKRRRDRFARQAHHIIQQQEMLNHSSDIYNGIFGNITQTNRSSTGNIGKYSEINGNYATQRSISTPNDSLSSSNYIFTNNNGFSSPNDSFSSLNDSLQSQSYKDRLTRDSLTNGIGSLTNNNGYYSNSNGKYSDGTGTKLNDNYTKVNGSICSKNHCNGVNGHQSDDDTYINKTKETFKLEDIFRNGNQRYTSGLKQRIQNGTLGHSVNAVDAITAMRQKQLDTNSDMKDDRTIQLNAEQNIKDAMNMMNSSVTPTDEDKSLRSSDMTGFVSKAKKELAKSKSKVSETDRDELKETSLTPDVKNDRGILLNRENSIKDLAQRLTSPLSPTTEDKPLRASDMAGIVSKAKKELAKSQSKEIVKSPTKEISLKVHDIKISENDLHWKELREGSLQRAFHLCDLDFSDLRDDSDDEMLSPTANSANGSPPPPPTMLPSMGMPPPMPGCFPPIPNNMVPMPPKSFNSEQTNHSNTIKKNKKTVKLFWREIQENMTPLPIRPKVGGFIWDNLPDVSVDTNMLEHLFESRTNDLIIKKLMEPKRNLILDAKRSNAINIAMKKLPKPQTIKAAIMKMDATVIGREGIEKLLTMLPTEEEKSKILEGQYSNPDLPLGSAEQFLLTLASINELSSRLKLWVFKLDFDNLEKEIAEPLMDLKLGIELLKVNKTFKVILSTLRTVGNYLNGNYAKGFRLEYLSKVIEVKDTVHKHPLLYHICEMIIEKFPDSTDFFSEVGPVIRASKVDFDVLSTNLLKLESDCKASWDHMKRIAKHDGSQIFKTKISEFLTDAAERIILLSVIKKRVMSRFNKFLLFLGVPPGEVHKTKPAEFLKVIAEFSLEYRTTRERVLQQLEKKANHRERNKTRGKMIIDVGNYSTKNGDNAADSALKELLTNDPDSLTEGRRMSQRINRKNLVNGGLSADDEILESLVRSVTSKPKPAVRERRRKRIITERQNFLNKSLEGN